MNADFFADKTRQSDRKNLPHEGDSFLVSKEFFVFIRVYQILSASKCSFQIK